MPMFCIKKRVYILQLSRAADLAVKEVSTVPRMLADRVADIRHHTQLSPGNCVNRMNLQGRKMTNSVHRYSSWIHLRCSSLMCHRSPNESIVVHKVNTQQVGAAAGESILKHLDAGILTVPQHIA